MLESILFHSKESCGKSPIGPFYLTLSKPQCDCGGQQIARSGFGMCGKPNASRRFGLSPANQSVRARYVIITNSFLPGSQYKLVSTWRSVQTCFYHHAPSGRLVIYTTLRTCPSFVFLPLPTLSSAPSLTTPMEQPPLQRPRRTRQGETPQGRLARAGEVAAGSTYTRKKTAPAATGPRAEAAKKNKRKASAFPFETTIVP